MANFEVVSKYAGAGINLPTRATKNSAGYDFEAAEDIIIPPYQDEMNRIYSKWDFNHNYEDPEIVSLKELADITKTINAKITLVPTGIKCKLDPNQYLELSVRSSTPLKHWLILGNGIGVIDSDYYNNPDNEGEIFFQLINLSPLSIKIQKGDKIGQGIIHIYAVTDDDNATGDRKGGFGSTNV